jgi:hypothetical protein
LRSSARFLVAACALVACASAANRSVPGSVPAPDDRGREVARETAPLTCPERMALVPATPEMHAYCIDRWEATLVEIDGGAERPFPFNRSPKDHAVRAVASAGVVPQGYISYLEAKAACAASSKRLCAETEWVRACKGPKGTTFPYGNDRRPGACNDLGTNAMLRMPPSARAMTVPNMNNPVLLTLPNTATRTGELADCTNEFGVFDMVGNLHEWIDDGVPPEQAMRNGMKAQAFCGGFFLDTQINGDGCNYKTTAHADWYHDYSTGFRCCSDAR